MGSKRQKVSEAKGELPKARPTFNGASNSPAQQWFAVQLSAKMLPKPLMAKYINKTLSPADIQTYYVDSLNKMNRWHKPTSD